MLFPKGIESGLKIEDVFKLGDHFFASVQPKFNTEATKQEMFWEIDVLSLARLKQNESVVETVESEVKRIMNTNMTREKKISTLVGLGKEYVALFRKLEQP